MNRPLVERGTGEREKRKGLSPPFSFPFAIFVPPKNREPVHRLVPDEKGDLGGYGDLGDLDD